MFYPRRSCEALASATLYNSPWGDIDIPTTKSLKEYQQWIQGIMQSENEHEKDDNAPLSRW